MLFFHPIALILAWTGHLVHSFEHSPHTHEHFQFTRFFQLTQSDEFSYEIEPCKNEFIFEFTNYASKTARLQYLKDFLRLANVSCYDIVEKNPVFDTLPSDFEVVRFDETFDVDKALGGIQNSRIKHISAQKKITRTLKSSKPDTTEDELDSNQDEYPNVYEDEYNTDEKKSHKKRKKSEQRRGMKPKHRKNRKIFRAIPKDLMQQLQVGALWSQAGATGANVNVAVLDTGLEANHPHFKNVRERIDWTDEGNPDDRIGHGTFVCGLIASSHRDCPGLAPDANLFVFKVFAHNQTSYTSWFLDAFNYALLKNIDVLNLSIGGPDFMDMPFVNKVWEITSKGIIMVSGIGNDGPLYGTLSNPADQLDIIGVGGINSDDQIAKFSSRGMTTWELPGGYGRVKPDLVTYCTHVRGSKMGSGCRTLSGTSVASPIVAGAVALLVSLKKNRPDLYEASINPGSVKQVLMASAERVEEANVFEQGAGKLNLARAYSMMSKYSPQASVMPSYIDLTECPYFWPYCSQPLYSSALPIIFNLTILNGMHVNGVISQEPQWHPSEAQNGHLLQMSFSYSAQIWPWSGYLAVKIVVSQEAADFSGVVEGKISLEIESELKNGNRTSSVLEIFVRARITPRPPRQQRLLWDQFHNLRYPPGYFPRDDLKMKVDPLDWNADHLHTNFKEMYQYLRSAGYYLETLGESLNCFDAENYGALLIFDAEEEFHPSEVSKLYSDVVSKGLSVIVFAEWYNASVIREAKFYDENTRKWWTPVTGGANVPALNRLLEPFGIGLGDRVYEGEFQVGDHSAVFVSGTSIVKFPASETNYLLERELKDEGEEFLAEIGNRKLKKPRTEKVPILGLVQTVQDDTDQSGRVVVYGDSNCVDTTHIKNDCFWLLSAVIEYACHKLVFSGFKETNSKNFVSRPELVATSLDENLKNYSKVLGKEQLECLKLQVASAKPVSEIAEDELPTKKNFYNFLRFGDEIMSMGFDEIAALPLVDKPIDQSNDKEVGVPSPGKSNQGRHNSDVDSSNGSMLDFPFLALVGVVLMFLYISYKLRLGKMLRSCCFKRRNRVSRRFSDKGKLNH